MVGAVQGAGANRMAKASARRSRVAAALSNVRGKGMPIPRIGGMFRRKGMETESDFDVNNLDEATKDRLSAVWPGFFKPKK